MKAFIFPGQGSQHSGMGKHIFEKSDAAKFRFKQANKILDFDIAKIMFEGEDADLKKTHITQPAIFLHSVILAKELGYNFNPDMVAGHSLGEFSALVAINCLSFRDGLTIVAKRAQAMSKACDATNSTMAAVLGLEDKKVDEVCSKINGVVPANYNCPGQLVISGESEAIDIACEKLEQAGARKAIRLKVHGGFHSPVMASAENELKEAIQNANFNVPICPIYQNTTANKTSNPTKIKENLIKQLTSPVRWTQSINQMIEDGAESFTEIGPGKILQGLVKKIIPSTYTINGIE